MRQVRMQVERIDSLQKMKAVDRGFDLDWRGRAIRLRFRTQPEPVRDRQAQAASRERANPAKRCSGGIVRSP